MTEKTETQEIVGEEVIIQKTVNISGDLTTLTVEELYDKDKFDLSTMEPGDVFQLLQYV
jgi:H+-transporting ATPase